MTDLDIGEAHKALTPAGRRWAVHNQMTSTIARVALHGADEGWPVAMIEAAVEIANYEAVRRAAERSVTAA